MRRIIPFVAAMMFFIACDSTEPEPLTDQESIALFQRIGDVIEEGLNNVNPASPVVMVNCPGGGTVTVNISFSGSETMIQLALELTPTGCQFAMYTIDGHPSVTQRVSFTTTDEGFSGVGDVKGTLKWKADGDRKGECEIDLTMNPQMIDLLGEIPEDATFSGMLCGHTVSDITG